MTKIPDCLYHYTSVNNLAYILSQKTIRFNRLDRVADLDEGFDPEHELAKQLVFVSCWTAEEKESIALWKLYTDFCGVRICLCRDMFMTENQSDNSENDLENVQDLKGECFKRNPENYTLHRTADSYNNAQRLYSEEYPEISKFPVTLQSPATEIRGPSFVRYMNDIKSSIMDDELFGLLKKEEWTFEHEVRFRVFGAFSIDKIKHVYRGEKEIQLDSIYLEQISKDVSKFYHPSMIHTYKPSEEYIDYPLSDEALVSMSILLGPQCEGSHKLIVEALAMQHLGNVIPVSRSTVNMRK